jgi:hypothetical protein
MSQESHDPELAIFARNLSGLIPSTGTFNRDRVLFAAGQARARGSIYLWRFAALAALFSGVGIFAVDRMQPTRQPAEWVVYVRVEVPVKSAPETLADESALAMAGRESMEDSPFSAYRLQQSAMRTGLEGLPSSSASPSTGEVLSSEEWRRGRFSEFLKP